jgi:hypothetical protein
MLYGEFNINIYKIKKVYYNLSNYFEVEEYVRNVLKRVSGRCKLTNYLIEGSN